MPLGRRLNQRVLSFDWAVTINHLDEIGQTVAPRLIAVTMHPLLVIILTLIVDDVEESQLIDTFAGRHNSQPISELLLLKELLCPANQRISLLLRHQPLPAASTITSATGDTVDVGTKHLQVLQVSPRERNMANNLDLAISSLRDRDLITQVAGSTLNLDLLVQELLESGQIEDLVAYWLRAVDGVLPTCQRLRSSP